MKEQLTLQEFVGRALCYGCIRRTTTLAAIGPRGVERWEYLKRGESRIGVLPNIAPTDVLTPTQLRSLVADLNLPALDFGFEFG